DQPIHRTEFAHDPEYPRRSAEVLQMLEAPRRFGLKLATDELDVPENTLLMGQADSSEKVRAWASVCEDSLLPVGGADFFGALLSRELPFSAPPLTEEFEFGDGRELFVCGTASAEGQR